MFRARFSPMTPSPTMPTFCVPPIAIRRLLDERLVKRLPMLSEEQLQGRLDVERDAGGEVHVGDAGALVGGERGAADAVALVGHVHDLVAGARVVAELRLAPVAVEQVLDREARLEEAPAPRA